MRDDVLLGFTVSVGMPSFANLARVCGQLVLCRRRLMGTMFLATDLGTGLGAGLAFLVTDVGTGFGVGLTSGKGTAESRRTTAADDASSASSTKECVGGTAAVAAEKPFCPAESSSEPCREHCRRRGCFSQR